MDASSIHFLDAAGQVGLAFAMAFIGVCAVIVFFRVSPGAAAPPPPGAPAPPGVSVFHARVAAFLESTRRPGEALAVCIAVPGNDGSLDERLVASLAKAVRADDPEGRTASGAWGVVLRADPDRARALVARLAHVVTVSQGARVGIARVPVDCRDIPTWIDNTLHTGAEGVVYFGSQASPCRELPGGWKDVAMPQEIDRALGLFITSHQHDPRGVSLLRLDIDHFKVYGEQYGPRIGGDMVQQLGSVLRRNVRLTDVVAHARDDEFVIMMPANPDQARCAALRILGVVRKAVFPFAGQELRLTVSFGIASYPVHALTPDGLMDLSEVALHSAKSRGRNTLVVYDHVLAAAVPGADVRDTL